MALNFHVVINVFQLLGVVMSKKIAVMEGMRLAVIVSIETAHTLHVALFTHASCQPFNWHAMCPNTSYYIFNFTLPNGRQF